MNFQNKQVPHLQLVSDKSDPMALLTHLMMALCESYHLDLTKTTETLQRLITDLKSDVAENNMGHDEFDTLVDFVIRIANSDGKTIKEFLQYVDKTAL